MELIKDELSSKIIETTKRLIDEKRVGMVTVRDILKELGITNRVFYNRFHNIDDVFGILYREEIEKARNCLFTPYDEEENYGDYIEKIAVQTLLFTYERQTHMSQFVFAFDSSNDCNYEWWINAIDGILTSGKNIGFFRNDLDNEAIAYSIWCFIRGFNADAVARRLPKNEAIRLFRYGFRCFMTGMCLTTLESK